MNILKKPSQDLVRKVQRDVGFEDRLEGYSLRERAGAVRINMYSLAGVASFLNQGHPRIDLQRFQGWVRDIIGDTELADRIRTVVAEPISDQAKGDKIRELVEERLCQCKEAV